MINNKKKCDTLNLENDFILHPLLQDLRKFHKWVVALLLLCYFFCVPVIVPCLFLAVPWFGM